MADEMANKMSDDGCSSSAPCENVSVAMADEMADELADKRSDDGCSSSAYGEDEAPMVHEVVAEMG